MPTGTSSALLLQHSSKQDIAKQRDQFYTRLEIAARLYGVLQLYINPNLYLMVEPCVGTGSFFRLLPSGSLGCDIDPKFPGTFRANFLTVEISSRKPIVVIGNPPFGKNGSLAVRFFNRAARQAKYIAMIVPRSFRKTSMQNRLDGNFHLIHDEDVEDFAFMFRGQSYNVRTAFQIWERRKVRRQKAQLRTTHPDFEFVTRDFADFAVQRVGANAGRLHFNFDLSPKSHYFIQGNVEEEMRSIEDRFRIAAGDVVNVPSLSKEEIIDIYSQSF